MNDEVAESLKEEKRRKQMEAIAEDLFNNEKVSNHFFSQCRQHLVLVQPNLVSRNVLVVVEGLRYHAQRLGPVTCSVVDQRAPSLARSCRLENSE